MKKIIFIVFTFFVFSCSCMTAKEKSDMVSLKGISQEQKQEEKNSAALKKEKQKKELEQVVDEAQAIIGNILQAMNQGSYEQYIMDFNATMKSAYHDKQLFIRTSRERRAKHGMAGARPVIKIEKKDPYYNIYYLIKFSKVEKPVPVFLSLKKEKGKVKVTFLQFQFSKVKE